MSRTVAGAIEGGRRGELARFPEVCNSAYAKYVSPHTRASALLHCLLAFTHKRHKAFDMGMRSELLTVPRRSDSWKGVFRVRYVV